MAKRAATILEKSWMGAVASMGCCVCRRQGRRGLAAVHHIRTGIGMGMRASHFDVLGLCYRHHQGEEGIHHMGRRAWERAIGITEMELLDWTKEAMAEAFPVLCQERDETNGETKVATAKKSLADIKVPTAARKSLKKIVEVAEAAAPGWGANPDDTLRGLLEKVVELSKSIGPLVGSVAEHDAAIEAIREDLSKIRGDVSASKAAIAELKKEVKDNGVVIRDVKSKRIEEVLKLVAEIEHKIEVKFDPERTRALFQHLHGRHATLNARFGDLICKTTVLTEVAYWVRNSDGSKLSEDEAGRICANLIKAIDLPDIWWRRADHTHPLSAVIDMFKSPTFSVDAALVLAGMEAAASAQEEAMAEVSTGEDDDDFE